MRVAIWGAGNGAYRAIDGVDTKLHTIVCLIDSNRELAGQVKNGIVVSHFSEVKIDLVDCFINTTCHFEEIQRTIDEEWGDFPKDKVFRSIKHFWAYEYVNIAHTEIKQNPIYQILQEKKFQLDTDKRLQYLDTYHKYFEKFKGKECVFCEIGVFHGDSLKMWKEYFGSKCKIVGIDVDWNCLHYGDDQVSIEIGSQSSPSFWKYIREKYPRIDILLDDGGHTMNQQITTYLEMFPHLNRGGIYLCEDIFTSFWRNYDENDKGKTFLDFSKEIVLEMEEAFWPEAATYHAGLSKDVEAIHFHQGIIVFEKNKTYSRIENILLR